MIVANQPRIKERWCPIGRTEKSQDYYVVRECAPQSGDYWEPRVDPDGVVRQRNTEAERLQFVEDQRYLIDRVNAELPSDVVDFGCGLGWLLSEIEGPRRIGIEQSAIAREWLLGNCEFGVTSDIESIDDHTADVLISHHVIEHLADPLWHLMHWRRVLRTGGLLVLATPDFGSPCAVRFGENYRMLHDPTHCSLFTLESCSRMLRDYGFAIEHVDFPFPERYATAETMERWLDTSKVSPPWPGNWMTFWCRK